MKNNRQFLILFINYIFIFTRYVTVVQRTKPKKVTPVKNYYNKTKKNMN